MKIWNYQQKFQKSNFNRLLDASKWIETYQAFFSDTGCQF